MNENDFCCIKRVIKSISITVPTKYISNEIAAVAEILEGWKRQYVPKLQGVVVNYRNIRLSTRTVVIHASRTAPKCVVTATFDLFCPTVGEIVKGTINRISREHIGCLIEGTVNVSIHRKKQAPPDLTKYIKLHQSILFEIESFSYDRQTIRVKGNITPECCELMKEVFPIFDSGSAQAVVNGFPLKDESALSDDLFSNTESAVDDAVNNLEVVETSNSVTKSPKKKSKKRKHESESPSVELNEKRLKLSNSKPSNFSVNGGSELQEEVNELSELPKPKSQKRKRESEMYPIVKPFKKSKPSNSDLSDADSSNDSSDHEMKSPSKKKSKKLKSESPKKGTDKKVVIPQSSDNDSSGSSSNSDDSDHDVDNILTKSPSKKLLKNLKSERESPQKGTDKNKVIHKSSDDDSSDSSSSSNDSDHDKTDVDNILIQSPFKKVLKNLKKETPDHNEVDNYNILLKSPSKKVLENLKSETFPKKGSDKKKKKHKSGDKSEKKKSNKKDSKPKLKKKSKMLAAGDVLKKDKKKSKKNKTGKKDIKKKDKKDKKKGKKKEKKDKTKDSKSKPVKIKSELG